jgi:hypothetical protein
MTVNMLDSKNIRNNIKVRSVVIAVILHIYLAAITLGISLLLTLISGMITALMLKNEISKANASSNQFSKNFPFKYFGEVFGSFQHIFYHENNLEQNIYHAIEQYLKSKTPIKSLETISITDVDKDLSSFDERSFVKTESTNTLRGTTITLIFNQSNYGNMQSIQWQVIAGGYIDQEKKFNLISYSLFTILFWIIPYLKREHDLLARVRTIYPGTYNDRDVVTQVRFLHEAIFDAMIQELESNGIDTSDLRAQKMQVMNISISGGKVKMGSIVQGAMNKITSVVKGANS